mmetsp:Transcript_65376/g.144642  ORF Transcript_65376/g.144642 Transcript_65376/m.144642 type:complete len:221 (-) Transcript_65376:505-1167(-)
MVRAPFLIQEEVPVGPTNSAGIQVPDDVMGIALAEAPLAGLKTCTSMPLPALIGCLARQQHRLWELCMDVPNSIEAVAAVPMEGDACNILCGQRIRVGSLGPLVDVILVMIEGKDEYIWVLVTHCGPEVRGDELGALLGREEASVPRGIVLGLVLHGDAPQGNVFRLVGGDPLRHVRRPRGLHAAFQTRPVRVVHLIVALHPGGGAPRCPEEFQCLALGL